MVGGPRAMWRRAVAAVVAAAWLTGGGGSAAAQGAAAFPFALDRDAVLSWLGRETDIAPDRVVAVTPQALTAVIETSTASPGASRRLVIRAEALTAETQARTGALSWEVSMDADCEGHRVRLGETTGYDARNLRGRRRELRATEADWRRPEAGTALDAAWGVACRPDFRGPFQAGQVQVAQADPSAPAAPKPLAAPAPAPTSAAKPAGPSARAGVVVQVGASSSEGEARALLRELARYIRGHEAWVEAGQVGGKVWRRALVGGFADRADASRFCAGLQAQGRACFVRAARPA